MSYDIALYPSGTKQREREFKGEDFFDNEDNLLPFTQEQFQYLKDRLQKYDYELTGEGEAGLNFTNSEYGIDALLTDRALYFSTSGDEDDIFEMGLTASEFTDTEEFEKYDPQNEGWEEI